MNSVGLNLRGLLRRDYTHDKWHTITTMTASTDYRSFHTTFEPGHLGLDTDITTVTPYDEDKRNVINGFSDVFDSISATTVNPDNEYFSFQQIGLEPDITSVVPVHYFSPFPHD